MIFSELELLELRERVDERVGEFGDEGLGLTIPSMGVLRIVMQVAEGLMAGRDEAETARVQPLIPRRERQPK